jgi:predicted RecB family nuclease
LCISVEAEPHSVGVCRTAKLANHGTQSAKDAESAHSAETSQANAEHLSLEERERQIAEAREAHPVSLYPTFKPRLDKILGDDAKEAA